MTWDKEKQRERERREERIAANNDPFLGFTAESCQVAHIHCKVVATGWEVKPCLIGTVEGNEDV